MKLSKSDRDAIRSVLRLQRERAGNAIHLQQAEVGVAPVEAMLDEIDALEAEVERLRKDRDEVREVAATAMRGIVRESEALERVRGHSTKTLGLAVPNSEDDYYVGSVEGRRQEARETLAILDGEAR